MNVSLGATLADELGVDVLSLLLFARIVECGGISQAAAELNLSRSAASRRLSDLEARIGVRLLARSARRLETTEAGEALLAHGRRVADETRAAADTVGSLAAGRATGVLRIAMPPTLAKTRVVPKLAAFVRHFPDISLRLVLTDLPFADISRSVDLAVRITAGTPEGFVTRHLCDAKWIVVGSPSYLAERGHPATPEEVSAHQCLLFSTLPRPAIWSFGHGSSRRDVLVKGSLRANNIEMLGTLAESGLGLAVIPSYAASAAVAAGRLVTLLPEITTCPIGAERIHVVYAPPTGSAPRLRAFLAFLEDCFRKKDARE
jgi:DNA-binding transcriptional LysR family regulator